ncbi:PREDICTED: uncharacterized protein LOC104737129 [Camelina sativa]|uniref:Uncharacterized protein LOC104737129 n=1 Tax=Camelina sativa TaxID=90675 RepID=A0ABM0VFV3_CAMSA|nr:PREDICTED: uncharacterized protein LOC104737129 [Camelina sativa]
MAPVTEHQSSFLSRLSRRNQVVSMDVNHEQELEELEDFQKHVAERFAELLPQPPPSDSPESHPVLSIQWLKKLLDVFMSCESEFHSVLTSNPSQISKPPLDKLVPEMLDRIVKALDICTAVVNGVDSVRQIQRLAEIAVTALKQTPLSDGSVRRAKRALASLLAALNADKNSGGGSGRRSTSEQWSSFGRRSGGSGGGGGCVSKNWSAAKQIQAMTANLVAPRGGEASPIYIMSSVMVMVMWTLVAAVPCQTSNGLLVHLPLPKHQVWASAAVSISERIGEEMKKKETRCGGLMEEMQRMERIGLKLMEFSEGFRFNGEEDVTAEVAEMEEICRKMEDGLEGLQTRVREVFHRLVKSRSEILEVIDH